MTAIQSFSNAQKPTTKSERNKIDAQAEMGMGATDIEGRMLASIGIGGPAKPNFQHAVDVPKGGVLFAIPALLACGLLHKVSENLQMNEGFFSTESVLFFIAFMALARIESTEKLRYEAPGEWGKLVGLDRIPEVKTLRTKISELSKSKVVNWGVELSKKWLGEATEDDSTVIYIDGHVRVYHGHQTALPKHYVSRQKLCLRSTCDYWVNGMQGEPFLKINKAIDPGIIKTIESDILPWAKEQIPNQPSKKQLESNQLLHRFIIIADREMYSPIFIWKLKQERIACQTYNKYPKENWNIKEFRSYTYELVSGVNETCLLAERGTFLKINRKEMLEFLSAKQLQINNNKVVSAERIKRKCGIWVREIRKLNTDGSQTAILSTNYLEEQIGRIAAMMFARWCQENYFKYAKANFGLNSLVDYNLEEIPEAEIINPKYRTLEGNIRKTAALLSRNKAILNVILLTKDIEEDHVAEYEKKKKDQQDLVAKLAQDLNLLKVERPNTPRHIQVKDLPKEELFKQLSNYSKHFVDLIKMVAYRAETAMANIIKEAMARQCDARSILQGIYQSEVDLIPNEKEGILTIRLHHLANHSESRALQYLCDELTETRTIFPDTKLRMVYELVSSAKEKDLAK